MTQPTGQSATELLPKAPFHFDLTCRAVAVYAGGIGMDVYQDGVYRRVLERDGKPLLVAVRCPGTVETPRLAIEVWGDSVTPEDVAWAGGRVAHIFGANLDLAPFYAMAQEDPVLGGLVPRLHGFHPGRTPSAYEALVVAITGQQIANVVARLIRADLVRRYGTRMSRDGVAYFAFPSPQALMAAGVEGLRATRLSTRKAEYILDLCARVAGGELDLEALHPLPREEVVERLCQLRGVGLWTAEWVMARALGRADAFPADDLALRRVLSRLYQGDALSVSKGGRPLTAEGSQDLARRWGDFRGLAVAYLFAGLRLGLLAEDSGPVGP